MDLDEMSVDEMLEELESVDPEALERIEADHEPLLRAYRDGDALDEDELIELVEDLHVALA